MNNALVCVSVCAETIAELTQKIELASKVADIIEIRFDCLSPQEMWTGKGSRNAANEISERFTGNKFIFTFRSPNEGGRGLASENERLKFWNSGFSAEIVDIERDIAEKEIKCDSKSRIVSIHVNSIDELPTSFQSDNADILKIASPVFDCVHALDIWKSLENSQANPHCKPVIPIAMGEAGKWTRILGPAFGSPITYASLDRDSKTAGGQIPAVDLRDIYRVKELDRETEIYGLLGNSVSHSVSTFLHNAAFREQEINAVYIPFETKDISAFFERMVRSKTREIEWNLQGLSVTIPFKQKVISELDFIDSTAEAIGAVNTVRLVDNQLVGLNTDAAGFIEPLKNTFGSLKNAEIAVIGSGGAARAAIYGLKKEGARPTIFARNPEAARSVAKDFACDFKELNDNIGLLGSCSIAVNATPLGTIGDLQNHTPILRGQMKNLQLVYDLVYNPYETLFLSEAVKAGIPSISGIEMLVSQASKQYELWTGKKAPLQVMNRAALPRLA